MGPYPGNGLRELGSKFSLSIKRFLKTPRKGKGYVLQSLDRTHLGKRVKNSLKISHIEITYYYAL